MAIPVDHRYYRNVRGVPFAARLAYMARIRVYHLFLETMRPHAGSRILDIGVSDEVDTGPTNLLERLYPHRDRVVCAGISDGEAVKAAYPGVQYVRVRPHHDLPFADGEFDLVYSNAVLEHVGSVERQAHFVREACRVGKRVFIVVPNRLFPVEVHTGIFLLHYLPCRIFRRLLKGTRFDFWADEDNLNYISSSQLRAIYGGHPVALTYTGIGFGPFRSNLASYTPPAGGSRPEGA